MTKVEEDRENKPKETGISLHTESKVFGSHPKLHAEKVTIIICSFPPPQPLWKAMKSAGKTQCNLLL